MLAGAKPSISGQRQGPSLTPKGPRVGWAGSWEWAASPHQLLGLGSAVSQWLSQKFSTGGPPIPVKLPYQVGRTIKKRHDISYRLND